MQLDEPIGEAKREREWQHINSDLVSTLAQYGKSDPFGEGDFFLVDDDYGTFQHKVECTSEAFFRSGMLGAVQVLLSKYASPWEVIFVLTRKAGGPAGCTVTRLKVGERIALEDE